MLGLCGNVSFNKGALEDVIAPNLEFRSQYVLLEMTNARIAAKIAVIAALS